MLACQNCGRNNQSDAYFCSGCGARLRGTATGLLPAQSLLRSGRYLIVETVGKGGMGAVYRALDTQLSRRVVALKEMSQSGLSGQDLQDAIATFTREAEMLARLNHPGLPHIYEQFEEHGRRYLVMEFIEGETLEARLQRNQQQGRRLPLAQALAIGKQICTVLDYLHTRQPPVIFRDLKPANIMLAPAGRVYLIDFGIARLFKPGKSKDTIALGSSGYAPPEQYRKATSPRSDIYSLGATLHQVLTGDDPAKNPFYFKAFSINNPRLEQLIMGMVALDQEQRPASVQEVRQALEEAGRSKRSGQKKAAGAAGGQGKGKKRRPLVAVVVAASSRDEAQWRRIEQQLGALLDGFPEVEIRAGSELRAIDEAGLIVLLLSNDFLAAAPCLTAANRAMDREEQRETSVIAVKLRVCELAGTRLEQTRTVAEDAIEHLNSYAQEQRILDAAKILRAQIVPLLLPGPSGGQMSLLQWLLWQLYGNGLSSGRYFRVETQVGAYSIKHVRPAGMAAVLLHLCDMRSERVLEEYVIGPLRCKDLDQLMQRVAPGLADPGKVPGVATRARPSHGRSLRLPVKSTIPL